VGKLEGEGTGELSEMNVNWKDIEENGERGNRGGLKDAGDAS
jgi:hypothetical protein